MSDDLTPPQRAQRLLDVATNMTVATVGVDGRPWVSPVFFVPDGAYDLYWTSEVSARHSENIRASGRVAIVVIEPDPDARVDALYMDASAVELSDPAEIEAATAVMATKPQPDRWMISRPADVSGDGPWRIYRAHPLSMDVRTSETRDGKPVARRQPADFRTRA